MRTPQLALCLLLTITTVVLAGEPAMPPSNATVVVAVDFQQAPATWTLSGLKHETESILSSAHVRVRWVTVQEATSEVFDGEMIVMRFKGDCASEDFLPRFGKGTALGYTHESNGLVLPFISIDCNRIGAMTQYEVGSLDKPRPQEMFGRALGRVAAHELYHALSRNSRHGRDGIAKPAFNSRDLVTECLQLDPADVRLLQEAMSARNSPVLASFPLTSGL